MPSLDIEFSDDEHAMLSRLTASVKASHLRAGLVMPIFNDLAAVTTPERALLDLLAAWDHGQADTAFNHDETPTNVPQRKDEP